MKDNIRAVSPNIFKPSQALEDKIILDRDKRSQALIENNIYPNETQDVFKEEFPNNNNLDKVI